MSEAALSDIPVSDPVGGDSRFRARLVLDVDYILNGESAADMLRRLRGMCECAIGNGMLTGASDAEVVEHSMDVLAVPDVPSEDVLAAFMLRRIENGGLGLEDIPVQLAKYGLMSPVDFAIEMIERMEMEND